MADIFISYAKEDSERAEAVAKALERLGWQVFWDRDIPPGKTWDEVLEKAVEAAQCMLVLWSTSSVASEWVRAEAEEGLQRKILIPVLLEEVRLPLRFRPVQAASLTDWKQDPSHPGFRQLAQAIGEIIGVPPPSKMREEPRSEVEKPVAEPPITDFLEPEETGAPAEARVVEAETGVRRPLEPGPDTAKPRGKALTVKGGVLIALVVAVVTGTMLFFRQELTGPRQEALGPQVKQEEPRKAPEQEGKASTPEVKAPDAAASTASPIAEPPVAAKLSVTSAPNKFTNSIGMEFVLVPAGSFTMEIGRAHV